MIKILLNHRGHGGHKVGNKLTEKIIGCAIEVHKELGPGLLESTYEQCLAREFTLNKINFKIQKSLICSVISVSSVVKNFRCALIG
jgi:GxxExxY protein